MLLRIRRKRTFRGDLFKVGIFSPKETGEYVERYPEVVLFFRGFCHIYHHGKLVSRRPQFYMGHPHS
jgi:hypothetical protein